MPFEKTEKASQVGATSPGSDTPERHRERLVELVEATLAAEGACRFELRARRGRAAGAFRRTGIEWRHTVVEEHDDNAEDLVDAVIEEAESIESREGGSTFQLVAYVVEASAKEKRVDAVAFSTVQEELGGNAARDENIATLTTLSRLAKAQDDLLVRAYRNQEQLIGNMAAMARAQGEVHAPIIELKRVELEFAARERELSLELQRQIEDNEASVAKWNAATGMFRDIGSKVGDVAAAWLQERLNGLQFDLSGAAAPASSLAERLQQVWVRETTNREAIERDLCKIDPEILTLLKAMRETKSDEAFRNIGLTLRKRICDLIQQEIPADRIANVFQRAMTPDDWRDLVQLFQAAGVF